MSAMDIWLEAAMHGSGLIPLNGLAQSLRHAADPGHPATVATAIRPCSHIAKQTGRRTLALDG